MLPQITRMSSYWETIMIEAMESGDRERYEMAKRRAYGELVDDCTRPTADLI